MKLVWAHADLGQINPGARMSAATMSPTLSRSTTAAAKESPAEEAFGKAHSAPA